MSCAVAARISCERLVDDDEAPLGLAGADEPLRFSGKPTDTGWGPERIARALAELMKRLG